MTAPQETQRSPANPGAGPGGSGAWARAFFVVEDMAFSTAEETVFSTASVTAPAAVA
jgi:hypothetical protein